MVLDPKLNQHLAHFGINVQTMTKVVLWFFFFGILVIILFQTVKSMAEMEIELNMAARQEWDRIQESGKKLQPLYGPGFTGLKNLGNTFVKGERVLSVTLHSLTLTYSCYMNSVLQILFTIPEFDQLYFGGAQQAFETAPIDPTEHFGTQMSVLIFHEGYSGSFRII